MSWGTPTIIGTSLTTTVGATSGNITSVTASVNDLVVVSGSIVKSAGSGVTVSLSDSAGNTYTVIKGYASGPACIGFIGWAYITSSLSAGTITVSISGGANWSSAEAGASKVKGAASSTTEDTSARATTNAAASTSPTITSGTPTNSGEIFFCTYANAGSTADTFTEDSTHSWTNLYAKTGTTSSTFSQSYEINSGSGTLIHNPTTTSRAYVQCIMAFNLAASGGGAKVVSPSLMLLGVGP